MTEAEKRYFRFLEVSRIETSANIPNRNMLCLMRLVRKGKVKAIITTNYDCHVKACFDRYGGEYGCILNPCIEEEQLNQIWNNDGYLSPRKIANKSIPIWKIHGDLQFVRMIDCSHIFSLPKFLIDVGIFPTNPIEHGHLAVFTPDGRMFSDLSLSGPCSVVEYKHHTDYNFARDVFWREMEAASEELLSHLQMGGSVFVVGLTL